MSDKKRWADMDPSESSEVHVTVDNAEEVNLLRSIDSTLKQIYKTGSGMSQAQFRSDMPGRQYDTGYSNGDRWRTNRRGKLGNPLGSGGRRFKSNGEPFKGTLDEFEDGLREALLESIGLSDWKRGLRTALTEFSKLVGVEVTDLPKHLGKQLGQHVLNNTEAGRAFKNYTKSAAQASAGWAKNQFLSGVFKYDAKHNTQFAGKFANIFEMAKKSAQSSMSSSRSSGQVNASNYYSELNNPMQETFLEDVTFIVQGSANIFPSSVNNSDGLGDSINDLIDFGKDKLKDASQNELKDVIDSGIRDSGKGISNRLRDILSTLKSSKLATGAQAAAKGSPLIKGASMAAVGGKAGKAAMAAQSAGMIGTGASSTALATTGATAAGGAGTALATTGGAGTALATTGTAAGAAAAGLASFCVPLLIAAAAMYAFAKIVEAAGPAIEGTKELFKEMSESAKRYQESRKQNLKYEKERIEADVKEMVQRPFQILEDAAQAWYQTWDENLRTITATQGYNKDDLYSLMGAYADRLRNEGLTGVVSSADINTNLANVLKSGLSGKVAEEFAYMATVLESAVPTQDWFSYGETYASIAANAIKDGKSQTEAIQYANEQMELFASNVLYASRQISGGFSSGLRDAQSLFESANKIAVSSRTGQVSTISGVLTSVSAIVGSVAPDLSSSLVEAVVDAATGGNSSELVALRSLAGVNASNTEFLKLLAQDPKGVFTELFRNLARMQNMSDENYMEVAEGLAGVFGISMEAFARVDFNYLADAISAMNVNNASLRENMELLSSGETTTNDELMKYRQINQYMLDKGLAYVMDNAAAREIQKHMWDEQIARELMEAEYAVNLQGSALTFLEGLATTVDNILNFLNPLGYLVKMSANLRVTAAQVAAQRSDLRQLLELGKVGSGNAIALRNLTTTGQDLQLTKSINALMGGFSAYDALDTGLKMFNTRSNLGTGGYDARKIVASLGRAFLQQSLLAGTSSTFWKGRMSKYDWDTVGKSSNAFIASASFASGQITSAAQTLSSSAASQAKSSARFQEFIDSMGKFVKENKNYSDWKNSAASYGIKDFDAVLDEYELSEQKLKNQFQQKQTEEGTKKQAERYDREEKFWVAGQAFWKETHPEWGKQVLDKQEVQIAHQVTLLGKIDDLYSLHNSFFKTFLSKWAAEFETHANYDSGLKASDISEIRAAEKDDSKDAILTLAQALTTNSMDLKDPAVQTNVLLSKILIVAEAIMQQNNQGSTTAMATTLHALALGLTVPGE